MRLTLLPLVAITLCTSLVASGEEVVLRTLTGSPTPPTVIQHLNLVGDNAISIAKAFELELNSGYTAVWAQASGTVLTIYSRAMGSAGNAITLAATMGNVALQTSGPTLAGGNNGKWRTDLTATPRMNRAARDWSRSFFQALKTYGIQATAAFSMELQHGDPYKCGDAEHARIANEFLPDEHCILEAGVS
jgi:hypothetical protein